MVSSQVEDRPFLHRWRQAVLVGLIGAALAVALTYPFATRPLHTEGRAHLYEVLDCPAAEATPR